jgi:hypothetical protein
MNTRPLPRPHWGIRFTGYLLTGTALWAFFVWRNFPDPLLVAGIVTAANTLVSELVWLWQSRRATPA